MSDPDERDQRICPVLDATLAELVSWRLALQSASDDDPEVLSSADAIYDTLAELSYFDLQRAVVLLLLDTDAYSQMVDAGLRDLHELAKTATVPRGWRR